MYINKTDEATSLKLLAQNHLKYCQNHDEQEFDLGDEKNTHLVGKLIGYLVTDFIKANYVNPANNQ